MSRFLSFSALALLSIGLAPRAPGRPGATPLEAVQGYRSWYCDTPTPVDMQARVALLCVGPARWDTNPANPHLPRLFKLYVNPVGKAAFLSSKPERFPVGSIVVKEKYLSPARDSKTWEYRKLPKNAKPELLTVMIKREKGFDPANGDWEYQVLSGDVRKSETKGLDHCAKCHKNLAEQDYVFQRHCKTPPEVFKRGYERWSTPNLSRLDELGTGIYQLIKVWTTSCEIRNPRDRSDVF